MGSHASMRSTLPGNSLTLLGDRERRREERRGEGTREGERETERGRERGRERKGERERDGEQGREMTQVAALSGKTIQHRYKELITATVPLRPGSTLDGLGTYR